MSKLIENLRKRGQAERLVADAHRLGFPYTNQIRPIVEDAADVIVKLRGALREIAITPLAEASPGHQHCINLANDALKATEENGV